MHTELLLRFTGNCVLVFDPQNCEANRIYFRLLAIKAYLTREGRGEKVGLEGVGWGWGWGGHGVGIGERSKREKGKSQKEEKEGELAKEGERVKEGHKREKAIDTKIPSAVQINPIMEFYYI